MENEKYKFENIEIPVYFFIENNKVNIDVEEMENELDSKIKQLQEKFK